MHPEKLTVWCGLWSGGIIGPFFFKNDAGATVTVNGIRYRAMINQFLFPEIDDTDVDDIWFQQDGATCHTANETINLLKEKFGESIISRNGPVNWPPRSCDLTPLDFFYGVMSSHCAMPTNQKQLMHCKTTLNVLSLKYSLIYVRESSKIGSKESML